MNREKKFVTRRNVTGKKDKCGSGLLVRGYSLQNGCNLEEGYLLWTLSSNTTPLQGVISTKF